MLKARKQTAMTIHRTVMLHMTPYNTGDIVISLRTTFGWSDGGPLPLKRKKVNNVVCTNIHKGQSNMVGTHKKGKETPTIEGGGGELVIPRARFTHASLLSVSFVPRVFSGTKRTVACVLTPPLPSEKSERETLSPIFSEGRGTSVHSR